jgi:hypothetical protein
MKLVLIPRKRGGRGRRGHRTNITFLQGRVASLRKRGFQQSDVGCHRAGLVCSSSGNGEALPAERSPVRSSDEFESVCDAVDALLSRAWRAANGEDPKHVWTDWWYGACVEATYKNLHYAEAEIVRLYSPVEVRYAIRDALRRARDALAANDPTHLAAMRLLNTAEDPTKPCPCSAADLSEIIQVGHEAADRSRTRLHTFRNILLIGTTVTAVLLGLLVLLAAITPDLLPLCFKKTPDATTYVACPGGSGPAAERGDVPIVAVLGLLGAALSAVVFIRGLYVNSTPYNVAIPLALSKLPAGALVAIAGVLLLSGNFVPGFSVVDQQSQILAYAFVLGFAQQLFTKMLDDRAERLVANVPAPGKPDKVPLEKPRL